MKNLDTGRWPSCLARARCQLARLCVLAIVVMELGSSFQAAGQMANRSDKPSGLLRNFGLSDEKVDVSSDRKTAPGYVVNDRALGPHDGTKDLSRPDFGFSIYDARTIPFWTDTFDYRGLRYTYNMVGTDPKRGSANTVIPTEIIPIRWVFSNGLVIDASADIVDGQTPVQGIINSPIFQDYDFTSGGTHVGNTQFGDAFQRANFWNSVSTRSPNYHVRLGTPTVMPTQTIVVPDDKVFFPPATPTGYVIPEIDFDFITQTDLSVVSNLGIAPESLPIVVWGPVLSDRAGGYHGQFPSGNSIHTFIATTYLPEEAYGYIGDVAALSHEIIEWMDDPFGLNYTAGWNAPFYYVDNPPPVQDRCQSQPVDLMETADPFESLGPVTYPPVTTGGFTYHLAEGAFIDFFTRESRSRSVNGQYSFFEILRPYGFETPPSPACVSAIRLDNEFFSVPGSFNTFANGMNNKGSIVGTYRNADGVQHGFKKDRSGYTTIDFPGAAGTVLTDINDGGVMVGYYFYGDGIPHGFSLKSGRLALINFPNSFDTFPEKINSDGFIVGSYDVTQPITHGFLFDGRRFQTVDAPFGQQSEAAAINDGGTIAGNSWTSVPGPQSGFLQTRNVFTRFDAPDQSITILTSINTFGDLGGYYIDSGPYPVGFVRLFGYSYVTPHPPFGYQTHILDVNDNREILGRAFNFAAGQFQPFIGHPALATGN